MAIMEPYDSSVFGSQRAASQIGRVIHPIILGNLELKLAKNSYDIEAAQKLRYRVFYEEMGWITRPIWEVALCEPNTELS